MDLSIIIISYNTREILQKCLDSVFRETRGISFEVIVVDNASADGTHEMLESNFPNMTKIYNKENRGFAAACNQGMKAARGNFILLLNSDTEVLGGAIGKTVNFMREYLHVGIAACKLLYPNRELQLSVRAFPSSFNTFAEATFLYLVIPKNRMITGSKLTVFDYQSARPIDWATGAFLMIRREAKEALGLLDEQFFMYSEEMDYCYRARIAGFQVWFFPEAEVVHHWGGVHAVTRKGILWVFASRILFVQKHLRGLEKYVILTLMYAGMVLRVPVYLLVGSLTANRQLLRKSYYFGYAIVRMLQRRLYYHRDLDGEVTPWTSAL